MPTPPSEHARKQPDKADNRKVLVGASEPGLDLRLDRGFRDIREHQNARGMDRDLGVHHNDCIMNTRKRLSSPALVLSTMGRTESLDPPAAS